MTSRVIAIRLAMLALVIVVLAAVSCTISLAPLCRGDSTPAIRDTSLVRCSTLDSLAARS